MALNEKGGVSSSDDTPLTSSTGTDKTETDNWNDEDNERTVTAHLEDCLQRGACCLATEVYYWENDSKSSRPTCIRKLAHVGVSFLLHVLPPHSISQ